MHEVVAIIANACTLVHKNVKCFNVLWITVKRFAREIAIKEEGEVGYIQSYVANMLDVINKMIFNVPCLFKKPCTKHFKCYCSKQRIHSK